jgi:diphthamide biosynthesis protein 2
MGKPNPAKLANFPEVEVFVMLADPQGLILDSKEYLSPIITPHEAYLAFTGREFDAAHYRLDFGDLLQLQEQQQQEQQQQEQQQAGVGGGADSAGGGGAAAAAAHVGGNITEVDGSEEGEEGDAVQQLSAAAGALVIAGSGGHSTALSSNKAGQQVQVHSAAQYLTQRRTYKGLETPATGAEILPASVAVAGRSGRAAAYVDEPQQ